MHDVFFNGKPKGLTKTPHEPPRLMRVPVEILVVVCVVVGIFPAITVGPLLAVASAATLNLTSVAALPPYSLSIWHGFNLPLLMSGVALVGGVGLYFLLQKKVNLHTLPTPRDIAKPIFDKTIAGLVQTAIAVTRITQNGVLSRYLMLIILTAVVGAAYGVWVAPALNGAGLASTQPASLFVLFFAVLGIAGALGTVVMYRERLTAIVFVGLTGLVVAVTFVYFSAPDLALTQALVELASVILMLLALYFLPARSQVSRSENSNAKKISDAVLALLAGGGMAWLTYQVLTRGFNSISPFYLSKSVSEGGGSNAVNVIIVDFRAVDTLGEIAVLGMAGLIVAVVVRGMKTKVADTEPAMTATKTPASDDANFAETNITNSPISGYFQANMVENTRPSLMLSIVSSLLLPIAVMVSVYFYLRGHNLPGGGFIAGLIFAVAIILQYVAVGRAAVEAKYRFNYAKWIGAGLLAAGLTGVGSMVIGFPFLTSTFRYFELPILESVPVASAMFFDLGVLLCVIGGTLLVLATLAKLGDAKPSALDKDNTKGMGKNT
jgi:multicomponent K+:H+ antiporter subunit A